jgi:hypothetical protein
MSWFEIIADRKIRDAIDEGLFDNLPGKGKPLPFDLDFTTPADQRLAARLMKDANILPDWIEVDKDVRRRREQWEDRLRDYSHEREVALRKLSPEGDGSALALLDRQRDAFLIAAARHAREYNRQVDRLNLLVPPTVPQRLRLRFDEHMAELETRFPRYLPDDPDAPKPWEHLREEPRPKVQLNNWMPAKRRRSTFG